MERFKYDNAMEAPRLKKICKHSSTIRHPPRIVPYWLRHIMNLGSFMKNRKKKTVPRKNINGL